jgi:hypothetical protein
MIVGSFAREEQLLAAVRAVRKRDWHVVDVHAPYPVHALEELLGWRRSRLPAACLLSGLLGVGFALWFQSWTSAQDWPLNVGGRPLNSWPAFVPVAFECMVLFAGFGLLFAWLFRCRLYPGKAARLPLEGVTDDRFAVAVRVPDDPKGSEVIRQLLQEHSALDLQEQEEEQQS